MTFEEIARKAAEALSQNPELARRNMEMRALLDRAQNVTDIVQAYRVGCIPPQAGPMQIQETEQAQFAACHMLLQLFMNKVDEGEDVARDWVLAVAKECKDYATRKFSTEQADDSTAH